MSSQSETPRTPADIYLQRHAALMVTNTRLRAVLLLLGIVIAVLAYALVALGRSYAGYKPLIIRINDVGHAEAVTYTAMEYKVQEAEIKYFLMDVLQKYYGRIRGTAKDDVTRSLYFLTPKLADQRLAEIKETKFLDDFLLGIGDQIEVTVNQISIEDLRQQPYKATVTYEKAYYSQFDHALKGRDKFTAHVQFTVMDKVPHNLVPINPLGLTITYLREDQAFTAAPAANDRPSPFAAPAVAQPQPPPAPGVLQAPAGQPAYSQGDTNARQ